MASAAAILRPRAPLSASRPNAAHSAIAATPQLGQASEGIRAGLRFLAFVRTQHQNANYHPA